MCGQFHRPTDLMGPFLSNIEHRIRITADAIRLRREVRDDSLHQLQDRVPFFGAKISVDLVKVVDIE